MGRLYTATFGNISQSASGDLMQIVCGADTVIEIHSIFFGQDDDVGDANADMGRVEIVRASVAGSGGSSINANPLDAGDAADSATILRHNSSAASGTVTTLETETFNWQSGWFFKPTPAEQPVISGQGILVIRLADTPVAAHITSMTIIFEEIG